MLVQGKDYKKGQDFKKPARVPATDRVMEMYRPPEPVAAPKIEPPVEESDQGELMPLTKPSIPEVEYLTRLYRSYLVVKVDGQLWVVDQHAAHERISYERLHRFQITGPDSQGLVVPFPLNLNAQEKLYLEEHRERFREVGFEFSEEEEEVSLSAVPPGLPGAKVEAFFEELLAELSSQLPSEKGTPVAQYREKLRAMMACKSSIRARENITSQEAVRLIQDLIQAEHSPYCPHGRPTRIRLDETTLERLFHRS